MRTQPSTEETGAVRTQQLEATDERRWQLALPKNFARHLDDRPANGCHRNRGSDFGGGDTHRVFAAAQNCSVTAVVSSVTFQPFVSAFSLANFCSF
jgi:hypothetical protein